jgi:hypothetical protein
MGETGYIGTDFVTVNLDKPFNDPVIGEKRDKIVLAWGDKIEKLGYDAGKKITRVRLTGRSSGTMEGTVKKELKLQKKGILKLSMVDVQQGDGLILETPGGKLIFIDGGDNKLFARYAAYRFGHHDRKDPLIVEAIVTTHGDADHFIGLTEIMNSETNTDRKKRLYMFPRRVYHSGIVKGLSKLAYNKIFGQVVDYKGKQYITSLEDDLRVVSQTRMNSLFEQWVSSTVSQKQFH